MKIKELRDYLAGFDENVDVAFLDKDRYYDFSGCREGEPEDMIVHMDFATLRGDHMEERKEAICTIEMVYPPMEDGEDHES